MPRRQKKTYSRPRKLYDKSLIESENALITKYGLKSRREVWKADFAIGKIRDIAKSLITAEEKDKKEFVERQAKKGFSVSNIADVLGLNKEDWLKRRLQSIVVFKGLAKTHKQARQLITHKHVMIEGKAINAPSHLTTVEEESEITMDIALPASKAISDEEKKLIESINHGEKEESEEIKQEPEKE